MTDNSKTYFGYPAFDDNPLEVLITSAQVLKTLSDLIGSCDDLSNLGDQMNGSLCGLSIIIDSAVYGIRTAGDELADSRKTIIDDYFASKGLPYEAMGNTNMCRAWQDGFRHGQEQESAKPAIGPATPFNEYFEEEKPQEKPETKKRATAKQLQVREKLIAASYQEGHSVTDISQAINLKRNQIEKVLFRLARENDFSLRPDEEKKLAANG